MNDVVSNEGDVAGKAVDAVETLPEAPTTTAIVAVTPPGDAQTAVVVADPPPPRNRARELYDAFLRGRKKSTLDAYRKDLERFAEWMGVDSPVEALRRLITSSPGDAYGIALDYRSSMIEQGFAPATVNRRLSSLKAMVRLACQLGHVPWEIKVDGLKSDPYRDTRGPGNEAIKAMLEIAGERGDVKGLRDVAILRLLRDAALRRGEVVALDVEHFDPTRGLFIMAKGRLERSWVSIPTVTTKALLAWLGVRDSKKVQALLQGDPLFIALNPGDYGHRLTGSSVYEIVKRLGLEVGVKARPHGLRHTAITTALKNTNGNLREVQKFSRHEDANTLTIYDDARVDVAGQIAELGAMPEGDDYDEPADEESMTIACSRGHVYEEKFIGKYCCRGECKGGARQDPARRIEERGKT